MTPRSPRLKVCDPHRFSIYPERWRSLFCGRAGGFTLIELMVVVGIMAIVLALGIPFVYKARNREAMNKTVRDVMEVCSQARAQAILQGKITELVFYCKERRCQVAGYAGEKPPAPDEFGDLGAPPPPPPSNSGLAAQIPESINIEMLDVNLTEYKDLDYARVRFYPNGTCDEMTLVLHSDKGVWLKIWLEITTSLADVGPVDR